MAEGPWFFCLKHHTVETRDGCAERHRLGPYDTREEAEHALWREAGTAGHIMGTQYIANEARDFGFGKKTGIDLPDERRGVVPDRQYYLDYWKAMKAECGIVAA